jgi:hypothetical protein
MASCKGSKNLIYAVKTDQKFFIIFHIYLHKSYSFLYINHTHRKDGLSTFSTPRQSIHTTPKIRKSELENLNLEEKARYIATNNPHFAEETDAFDIQGKALCHALNSKKIGVKNRIRKSSFYCQYEGSIACGNQRYVLTIVGSNEVQFEYLAIRDDEHDSFWMDSKYTYLELLNDPQLVAEEFLRLKEFVAEERSRMF